MAQGKNTTFLFGRNEKDTASKKNVMEFEYGFPHISILDADILTLEVIREAARSGLSDAGMENNYYGYKLQRILRRDYRCSSIFLG